MLDSSQPATQNPQTSATASGFAGSTSQVQPVTTTDTLSNNQNGIPLIVNSLPVVSLGGTSTITQTVVKPVVQHKTNDVMLGLAATLFVAALVIFWAFSRQAKNSK